MMKAAVVLVAAGKSSRMGGGRNKVLFELAGRPVLSYSLEVVQRCSAVSHVAVVGREEDQVEIELICKAWCSKAEGHFVAGGAERFDSVKNGLEHFSGKGIDFAIIQDAARPFLEERYILDSIEAMKEVPGCVIGVPMKDTLKETDDAGIVQSTHDRSKFWLAQTPQIFWYESLLKAYRACTPPPYPTDDAAVLEDAGLSVKMILGSYRNMKITNPEDILLAAAILRLRQHSLT